MLEDAIFATVLSNLEAEMAARPVLPVAPLGADSWIVRSAMQKAIRRGMADLALSAAAALVVQDRRTLWRRLLVTALEDLGPGEIGLTTRIIAAMRSSSWRAARGGDWPVVAELISQACAVTRCQAANDLWNIAKNDAALDGFKATLVDADTRDLVGLLADPGADIAQRAVGMLVILGEDIGPLAPLHLNGIPKRWFVEMKYDETGSFSCRVCRQKNRVQWRLMQVTQRESPDSDGDDNRA